MMKTLCLIFRYKLRYKFIANYSTPRQAMSAYPGGTRRVGFWHAQPLRCEAVKHTSQNVILRHEIAR